MTLVCLSGGAIAQTPAPQSDSTTKPDLTEVVVVARKRVEKLQDVPVSASVVSAQALQDRGLNDIRAVIKETPNVSFPDTTHSNVNLNIVIRGISSNTRSVGFESGVGVYVDGIYLGRPLSFNQEFVDLDHIEVLRGPQGTLFGKNNLAGSINIITKQPEIARWEVGATAQYARFDDRSGNAYLNLPLGERVAARFNGYYHESDGYILNTYNGDHYANDGTKGGRARVLFLVTDDLKLTVGADYRRDDFNPALPEVIVDRGVPGFAPVVPGPSTTINNVVPVETRDLWGISTTAEYALPRGFTLTSISAYREAKIFDELENDNDVADKVSLDAGEKERHFSQELRLTSPGNERLDYVLGAYYLRQKAYADKIGFLFPPNNIHSIGEVDTSSWALFGDTQLQLARALKLGAGLRYTHERKELLDFRQTTSALLAGIFPSFPVVGDSRSVSNFSPAVSLSYEFSNAATSYAKVSRGFKSGGWNVDFITTPTAPVTNPVALKFDDERLTSYELGLKTQLFDRRLRFDSAIFYMNYQNQQVQQRVGPSLLINNAASSKIYGAEFDFSWSLTPDVAISGGGGYLHAAYDSFKDCTPTLLDCSGNRLSDAPQWNGTLAVDWSHSVRALGRVSARVDYTYRGNNYSNTPTADPLLLVPSYQSTNMSLGFGPEDDKWRLTLFVNNVFDRVNSVARFIDTIGDPPGTLDESYAPPRVMGVRFNVRFAGSR